MSINVGEMPLEIFVDFVSEKFSEEWNLSYFLPLFNSYGYNKDNACGDSCGSSNDGCSYMILTETNSIINMSGSGMYFGYGVGFVKAQGNGCNTDYGNGFQDDNLEI